MLFIILILLAAAIETKSEYKSGVVSFSNGHNSSEIVFDSIQNPNVIYCITEFTFNSSLSISTSQSINMTSNSSGTLILTVVNYNPIAVSVFAIKFLITPRLKGWTQQDIKLDKNRSSTEILMENSLNRSRRLNKQYFVTGFSSVFLLQTIIVDTISDQHYIIEFKPNSGFDWIQITFIIIDLSITYGCPGNNMIKHYMSSQSKNQSSWMVNKQQGVQILAGINSIGKTRGSFKWNYNENKAQVSEFGQFTYTILQIDTACNENNVGYFSKNVQDILPIIVQTSKTSVPLIQSQNTTTNIEKISPNKSVEVQQSSNVVIKPQQVVQQSNNSILNNSNTENKTIIINNATIIQKNNSEDTIKKEKETPKKDIFNAQSKPQTKPEVKPQIKPQVKPVLTPVIIPTPPIKSNNVSNQSINTHIHNGIVQQRYMLKQPPHQDPHFQPLIEIEPNDAYYKGELSAWKILGFIGAICIGISLITLPFLCCALKCYQTKNNTFNIEDRIYPKGTDIRLVNDVVGTQQIFSIKKDVSLSSKIAIELGAVNPQSAIFQSQINLTQGKQQFYCHPTILKSQVLSSKNQNKQMQQQFSLQYSQSIKESSQISNAPSSHLFSNHLGSRLISSLANDKIVQQSKQWQSVQYKTNKLNKYRRKKRQNSMKQMQQRGKQKVDKSLDQKGNRR